MIASVELNLGDRALISRLISQTPKLDIATARQIREVRGTFDLRDANRKVDKLNSDEDLQTFLHKLFSEHVLDNKDLTNVQKNTLNNIFYAQGAGAEWSDICEAEVKTYTIDDAYILWLRELMEDFDWSVIHTEQGPRKINVPADTVLSIADLDDKLRVAREEAKRLKPNTNKE